MSETPVHRYLTLDESRERFRPVLTSIIENFGTADAPLAADMILRLVDVPQRRALVEESPERLSGPTSQTPPPTPPGKAPKSVQASQQPSTGKRGIRPPVPELKQPLDAFEWYSMETAMEALGLGRQMVYNYIKAGDLQSKKVPDEESGRERALVLGRTILALRHRREKNVARHHHHGNGNAARDDADDDGLDNDGDGAPAELGTPEEFEGGGSGEEMEE